MFIEAARVPDRIRLFRWDGENESALREHLLSVAQGDETAFTLTVHRNGSATLDSPLGVETIVPGTILHVTFQMFGGLSVVVYPSEDVDKVFYLYPDLPPVSS